MSRRIPGWAIVACVALAASPGVGGIARASEPIASFAVETSNVQAGAHPDLSASFELESPGQPEVAKNIVVNMPEGVFGNPGAVTRCSSADFALNECGSGSQVGLITVYASYEGNEHFLLGTAPLYDLQAESSDQTALLAFVAPTVNVPVSVPVSVRTSSDYGLRLTISGIPQLIPLALAQAEFWGFPAETSHDVDRFYPGSPGAPPGCPGLVDAGCLTVPHANAGEIVRPFIDNPTVCTGQPLPVSLEVRTYQDPAHSSTRSADYPATTACEKEKFDPVFSVGLTTDETDSPSGLDLQLEADQFLDIAPTPSELRSATVTLPEGLSINPDAADGQSACTDAQADFGSEGPANCPDNSKIGTVEVHTPALEGPLTGSLFIGEPKPGDQYRLFMVFEGFGIHAKLFASVKPDPQTGQLTISLEDLPQVPFEEFDLHLFASDRGLVATPTRCRVYAAAADFTPWNGVLAPQHSAPFVSLTSGPGGSECPGQTRPFHPRLVAGTSNPLAGAFSAFHLKLDRDDGDQFLKDLNFKMPPGFTGSLRGISYCPEAQIAAAAQNLGRSEQSFPSCPASSFIGTTNVAAGPGSHPFHAVGRMYLAGPLNGAPLSLAAITPALAGPYDYGVVVVRVALHVDPLTAQVTAASDPMPQIVGGIPIRMRSIQVNIDKPNFTINPTNCNPLSVDSQGIGAEGSLTDFSSYFQVVNCAALPFKPKMTIAQLGGKKQTKRSKDPSLRFDLNTRPGDANIKSVAVTLPTAFSVDQRHLGNICSKAELASKLCAGRQAIGTVETTTPLLDQPLKGPAYAVSGYGILPHIVFILAGQVVLLPEAESSSVKGHLRTVVPVVPDAPIGHFRLTLFGGSQGYITNTESLCAVKTTTVVEYTAQNGRKLRQKVAPKTACPKAGRQLKRHRRHAGR